MHSEPTAAALIGIFCELAKHPEHIDKVYEELKDVDVTDLKTLTSLPHLNAVINEGLRLYPALLTGGARKTTENGATIGGTFIPPNTTIIAPRHVISRSESSLVALRPSLKLTIASGEDCFERPNEFIPERWSTRPEMVRNASAFAPFGTGMEPSRVWWLPDMETNSCICRSSQLSRAFPGHRLHEVRGGKVGQEISHSPCSR